MSTQIESDSEVLHNSEDQATQAEQQIEQDTNIEPQGKKSKILNYLFKFIGGVLIVFEWVIGLAMSEDSSDNSIFFSSRRSTNYQFDNLFLYILGMLVINLLTVILVRHIVNRLLPDATSTGLTNVKKWIVSKAKYIKSIVAGIFIFLEWWWWLSYMEVKLSTILWILFANFITFIFLDLIHSKLTAYNFKRIFQSFKGWCSNHIKSIVFTIIIALVLIISYNYIDYIDIPNSNYFEEIRISRSEKRIEKSIASKDPYIVREAVEKSVKLKYPINIISKLIKSGNIDEAIYLYNYKTSHCSRAKMKKQSNEKEKFSLKACTLIYNALINSEQMDKAWEFHSLESENPNDSKNSQCYYSYLNDVVKYYCVKKDKPAAQKFVKQHISWYVNNVDEEDYVKKHPQYQSSNVKKDLMKRIENY